jgi:AmmeMemoRadiSam system protein A
MHYFIMLAQEAIKTYLSTGQVVTPPVKLPACLQTPGAVFVSLHTATGQLRGCRGTLTPTEPTLAEAIIKTAIASATDDPRFPPMLLPEMNGLQIKIDVLSPLEPVTDISLLDEKVYGVVIKAGSRRAVLLPDIAAVDSVSRQLEMVRRKAGIGFDEPADLFRFTVTRYDALTPWKEQ